MAAQNVPTLNLVAGSPAVVGDPIAELAACALIFKVYAQQLQGLLEHAAETASAGEIQLANAAGKAAELALTGMKQALAQAELAIHPEFTVN